MAKRLTEDDFWNNILEPQFKKCGYFTQRFEQFAIPDAMVSKNKRDTWLELKTIDNYPVHKGTRIRPDWRPGQLPWLERYRKKGGFAYLALWIDEDIFFLIPQESYSREELVKLSRGITGGQYDKGNNE